MRFDKHTALSACYNTHWDGEWVSLSMKLALVLSVRESCSTMPLEHQGTTVGLQNTQEEIYPKCVIQEELLQRVIGCQLLNDNTYFFKSIQCCSCSFVFYNCLPLCINAFLKPQDNEHSFSRHVQRSRVINAGGWGTGVWVSSGGGLFVGST